MSVQNGIGLHSSLKRIAWAYGCAKKDSDEEQRLRELLNAKMKQETDDVHPQGP